MATRLASLRSHEGGVGKNTSKFGCTCRGVARWSTSMTAASDRCLQRSHSFRGRSTPEPFFCDSAATPSEPVEAKTSSLECWESCRLATALGILVAQQALIC